MRISTPIDPPASRNEAAVPGGPAEGVCPHCGRGGPVPRPVRERPTVDAAAEEPRFFDTKELQARWKVGRTTIHREVKRGRLRSSLIGGSVRFSREEVARYEQQARAQ
jgi:excisionase family DNA binding protein